LQRKKCNIIYYKIHDICIEEVKRFREELKVRGYGGGERLKAMNEGMVQYV
jgi:hypothetical protein